MTLLCVQPSVLSPGRPRAGSPGRRAFTLIELILALGLTVVIATVLTSSVFIAFHAKTAINNALDVARTGDTTAILAQELANSLLPTPLPSSLLAASSGLTSAINSDPNSIIGQFTGAIDNVDFFTTGPEPKADLQPDVREVQYALAPDPGGTEQNLVRRVTTNLLPQNQGDVPPDEIICRNVQAFTLSYYDGTDWTDSWDPTVHINLLPLAVQFTVELAAKNANEKLHSTIRIVPIACAQPAPASSATAGGVP